MTTTLDGISKIAKSLPEEAKAIYVTEYNKDFAQRCSESHAEKAAWRVVRSMYKQDGDAWIAR
jgi:cation transport regulator ChaB